MASTRIGNYFVAKEGERFVIRRHLADGSQPRYPATKYAHLHSKEELQQLCNRLNHAEDREKKRRIEIRTSFIPVSIMESFRAMLSVDVPNEKDFRYIYYTVLQRYFLGFFVGQLGLLDPKEWKRNQEKWGSALIGKSEDYSIFDMPPSAKTLKTTLQTANRFMRFLNAKMPEEYELIVFTPLSKAAIKEHEAKRKLLVNKPIGSFVNDEDWITIDEALPIDLGCYIRLMYCYGLRRSETLGFTGTEGVRNTYLWIKAQAKTKDKIEPLKDREQRKTPHWFASPKDAYTWIGESLLYKVHPDTLSEKWEALMEKLHLSYNLHDLRRTFITKALRSHVPRDVQLAVGHASLSTTMKYAQDDRSLDNDEWKPDSA